MWRVVVRKDSAVFWSQINSAGLGLEPRYRKHQPDLEVRGYLLKVLGGKVSAVVRVEDVGHAADLPVRMTLTPYPLPQSKRGSDGASNPR